MTSNFWSISPERETEKLTRQNVILYEQLAFKARIYSTKSSRLMLFKEAPAVYCEKRTKHKCTLRTVLIY
jgi:hypothetical protein